MRQLVQEPPPLEIKKLTLEMQGKQQYSASHADSLSAACLQVETHRNYTRSDYSLISWQQVRFRSFHWFWQCSL